MLALPLPQRRVLAHLVREGPSDLATLAQILAQTPDALQTVLAALAEQGAILQSADGRISAQLGRTRQRTLPARLWPALQTANRLYSAQELAALRTVVPILQFARAKLGEFTDHGPGHVLRVKSFATQLGAILGLTTSEQHLLRAAALFHDVGNVVERERHHIISQEAVEKLAATGQIPFGLNEAALVGLLCRWHRKAYEPERRDELHGETIRTGLLASILRVADALDSDYRRFDYSDKFMQVIAFFYPHELYFWQGLAEILGIRLHCTPEVHLQVFVQQQTLVEENYHIRALRKDVADTPFDWPVNIIKCGGRRAECGITTPHATRHTPNSALVVAPFDPHSLVMAALSRKHLLAAGYRVELLIYPDTEGATTWLWQSALVDLAPANFAQLVVIGDRPEPASEATQLATLADWQAKNVQCTLLNRHEANWVRLPALLRMGVHVSLGGDWAYFWGETADEADLFWGRIAALCTRDPIQSTVGLTADEATITQGLLAAIYQRIQSTPATNEDWAAHALPLLEQIAADGRAWFAAQADAFVTTYTTLPVPARVTGKVLRFELSADTITPALFWGLEAAIEAQGRQAQRGITYTTPYAIATWAVPGGVNDQVELLAISHWREEDATPIRLLYPTDLGPAPEGNESAIRVRLSQAQADNVISVLLAACNQP
jgi:hypothetical protein